MEELIEAKPGEIIDSEGQLVPMTNIAMARTPEETLHEARGAAQALQDIISKKKKPVKFNGEQYLEFEDWQTLARFYGLTVKVDSTKYVEFGDVKGFEARASVVNVHSGIEVSAAESLCLNDERNWSSKPLFQLKSMSQTRACSKALRNVLAWVVVLAGYKPTPAEEMYAPKEEGTFELKQPKKVESAPAATVANEDYITVDQRKSLYDLCKKKSISNAEMSTFLRTRYNVENSAKIKKTDFDKICADVHLIETPVHMAKQILGGEIVKSI